jgi:outer membrane protein assembly factor BamA
MEEGVRYRLQSQPRVLGTRRDTAAILEAAGKVKAGDYYDQNKLDRDIAQIRDYLGAMGHEVRVLADPVFSPTRPGLVQVQYAVESGKAQK